MRNDFATTLQRKTKSAIKVNERLERKKRKTAEELQKLAIREAKKRARTIDLPAIKKEILESAGSRHVSYEIYSLERNPSREQEARAYHLVTLLEKLKLKAVVRHSSYEPCGSDPYYPYSATSCYVDVEW